MPKTIRTFSPETAVQSAQGLDVANFQGHFNWAAAKAGYSELAFGIYKMTEGTGFTDADAGWNHDQIKAQGLHHGAYHFLHPDLDGAAQAQFFVAQHRKIGLNDTDMLWLDNETAGRSPAQVSACAVKFMNELQKLCPVNPKGVYTGLYFALSGNDAGLGHWPSWLAAYQSTAPQSPPPWAHWTFWQWGQRNGIDADAFNGTKADLDTWIASFSPSPPPPPPPPPPSGSPYRHTASWLDTPQSIAAARNTTVEHIAQISAAAYTPEDLLILSKKRLRSGIPYYTDNP